MGQHIGGNRVPKNLTLHLAGPEGGYPYLNVGNGGPIRLDGSPAEAGGTKLYLSGNWGPKSPAGSTNVENYLNQLAGDAVPGLDNPPALEGQQESKPPPPKRSVLELKIDQPE